MLHPILDTSPGEASPSRARALQSPSASLWVQIPALPMSARRQAWQFAAALVFFHGSEYVLAAAFHGRRNVTATSLLISKQYVLAMGFAMLEHLTEMLIFPEVKKYWFVSNIGLLMMLIGEIIRKLAVVTAGRAFTHVIRIYHEDQHQLVTHGVYRFMRHPGYFGFLLWAVGTQVMLCNPVSTVAFTYVLWRFFSKRIPYEEYFLRQFFGSEYEEYALRVHSGLPFIKYACLLLLLSLIYQSKQHEIKDNKERSHEMDRIQYKTYQKFSLQPNRRVNHQLIDPVQI